MVWCFPFSKLTLSSVALLSLSFWYHVLFTQPHLTLNMKPSRSSQIWFLSAADLTFPHFFVFAQTYSLTSRALFFLLLFLLPVSNLVFFPVCLTSPLSPAFVSLWSAAKGKRQFGAADLKDDCMHFVYLHLWHALCYMWKLEVSCLILHFGAFSSYCKFKIQDGSAVLTWGNNISVRWAVIRYFLLFHRNLT